MLLRSSISTTKKFFQKTVDSFKSFLSKGSSTYERLPKTPPFHPFSCGRNDTDMDIETGYKDLDNFYTEFTQWDSQKSKLKSKGDKKAVRTAIKQSQEFYIDPPQNRYNHAARTEAEEKMAPLLIKQTEEFHPKTNGELPKENNTERREVLKSKRSNAGQGMKLSDLCSRSVKEKRFCSVAQKLKELEQMDKGNVEHKLDIEQALHYYSRLTCPAYLDIVDKFFMEMCAEFFGPQASQQFQKLP